MILGFSPEEDNSFDSDQLEFLAKRDPFLSHFFRDQTISQYLDSNMEDVYFIDKEFKIKDKSPRNFLSYIHEQAENIINRDIPGNNYESSDESIEIFVERELNNTINIDRNLVDIFVAIGIKLRQNNVPFLVDGLGVGEEINPYGVLPGSTNEPLKKLNNQFLVSREVVMKSRELLYFSEHLRRFTNRGSSIGNLDDALSEMKVGEDITYKLIRIGYLEELASQYIHSNSDSNLFRFP